jgi:uncharacterized Ntn-hydrolase superfamily protein
MTFSIVAHNPENGQFGIAVASRFFAVGSLIPHFGQNCAIASQALVNPMWGREGTTLIEQGLSLQDTLEALKDKDSGANQRQVHMVNSQGEAICYTGSACIDVAYHRAATHVSVAGNMLASEEVIYAILEQYLSAGRLAFAERLLAAMQAGEAAGGDKRGRQSASLQIKDSRPYPLLDLRVDDHGHPLYELERLLSVSKERFAAFVRHMGDQEHFSGNPDREQISNEIEKEAASQKKLKKTSLSMASNRSTPEQR